MNGNGQGHRRRQGPGGDHWRAGTRRGAGRDRHASGAAEGSLTARTARRTLVAVGAYMAQDLRDPDGVARPLLRRTAIHLQSSGSRTLRRVGEVYLHRDPPTPEELAPPVPAEAVELLPEPDEAAGRRIETTPTCG